MQQASCWTQLGSVGTGALSGWAVVVSGAVGRDVHMARAPGHVSRSRTAATCDESSEGSVAIVIGGVRLSLGNALGESCSNRGLARRRARRLTSQRTHRHVPPGYLLLAYHNSDLDGLRCRVAAIPLHKRQAERLRRRAKRSPGRGRSPASTRT